MKRGGDHVTRALFERNMENKLQDPGFDTDDIKSLLAPGCPWDVEESARIVLTRLISLLPGEPWKGEE